jgi:ribosomal protein S18 acetylase RimI-like enzyme
MPVLVRPGNVADAPALAPLAARTFRDGWEPVIGAEAVSGYVAAYLTAERFAEELADPGNWFGVAADADTGALAGYARLDAAKPAPDCLADIAGRPLCLQRLYVAAEHRGAGVADLLLAATEAEAVRRGGDALWLEADPRNERAWRFYLRRGFVEKGRVVYHYPGGYNDNVRVLLRPVGAAGEPTAS